MIVKLSADMFVEIDSKNYTLHKEITSEKGNRSDKILGYFSSLDSALKHYLKYRILTENENTVDIETAISEIKNVCDKTISEIKKIIKSEVSI